MSATLAGEGVHAPWRSVPARVRRGIEERLGDRVVATRTRRGGFSPGLAAEVRTLGGDRLFVKAVGPERNPDAPSIHRREASIHGHLPAGVQAPRMRWVWDEGPGGWVAVAFDLVEGRMPAVPWRPGELDRVLEALTRLSDLRAPAGPFRDAAHDFAHAICGWQRLRTAGTGRGLASEVVRRLDALCDLEARAPAAVTGEALVHLDVRRDNVLLADDGRTWIVDWPHARRGAPWLDGVLFAPSLALQGGPPPEAIASRLAPLLAADPAAVDAAIAAMAGYFVRSSLEPPPPGLPTVRAFQAAQGEVALRWVFARRDWAPPPR